MRSVGEVSNLRVLSNTLDYSFQIRESSVLQDILHHWNIVKTTDVGTQTDVINGDSDNSKLARAFAFCVSRALNAKSTLKMNLDICCLTPLGLEPKGSYESDN